MKRLRKWDDFPAPGKLSTRLEDDNFFLSKQDDTFGPRNINASCFSEIYADPGPFLSDAIIRSFTMETRYGSGVETSNRGHSAAQSALRMHTEVVMKSRPDGDLSFVRLRALPEFRDNILIRVIITAIPTCRVT